MTVMITGGAGFVGLNITERLLDAGQNVVCYGLEAPPSAFINYVKDKSGQLNVVVGDVRNRTTLLEALSQFKVSKLVHGAAVTANLEREIRQPEVIAEVNLIGTIEVLEAAFQHGVQRVIQLGSGAIFGTSVKETGSLDEEKDIPVPDTLYGITKYAAERVGLRYHNTRGLNLVVARVGTCFGRWEYDTGLRDTLSIPFHLTLLAERGEKAIFNRQLPDDWVYATDVANAVVCLLDMPKLKSQVYHVSSGGRWSAVRWCERLLGVYPNFSFEITEDPSSANVGVSTPTPRPPFSIERLKLETGFVPNYNESFAFRDYIDWRRNHIL